LRKKPPDSNQKGDARKPATQRPPPWGETGLPMKNALAFFMETGEGRQTIRNATKNNR